MAVDSEDIFTWIVGLILVVLVALVLYRAFEFIFS